MNNQSSGGLGILGLVGISIVFFLLRRFFPALSTAFLVITGIVVVLVIALVVLVLIFALRKPKKPAATGLGDPSGLLSKGRSSVVQMRQLVMRLKAQNICTQGGEVLDARDKILRALKDQPGDITRVRQFFFYYLPTLDSILKKYANLEASGVMKEDTAESVLASLQTICTAMDKMYASLFDDDALDRTVEMDVLTQICKKDGLL